MQAYAWDGARSLGQVPTPCAPSQPRALQEPRAMHSAGACRYRRLQGRIRSEARDRVQAAEHQYLLSLSLTASANQTKARSVVRNSCMPGKEKHKIRPERPWCAHLGASLCEIIQKIHQNKHMPHAWRVWPPNTRQACGMMAPETRLEPPMGCLHQECLEPPMGCLHQDQGQALR